MNNLKCSPLVILVIILIVLPSCISSSSTLTTTDTYSISELKYLIIDKYTELFWCDPDFYPIAREDLEQQKAVAQFPGIQANNEEFTAILHRLTMEMEVNYSDTEKLLIYRQYKLLNYGLEFTGMASPYNFAVRIGENQGFHITGTITSSGTIKEITKETSFNTCPICLAKGTMIDTPLGPVPVENMMQGMLVWTVDASGRKIEATLIKTVRAPVPSGFVMIKLTLADGRMITASPGHPTVENRPLESYQKDDTIDGSKIIKIEKIVYLKEFTYDILPIGPMGLYWANGILLKSTLAEN